MAIPKKYCLCINLLRVFIIKKREKAQGILCVETLNAVPFTVDVGDTAPGIHGRQTEQ